MAIRQFAGSLAFSICAMAAAVAPAASQAPAAQPAANPFETCMKSWSGVTAEALDCIGAAMKPEDARLNETYRKALGVLPPDQQNKLKDAQRKWVAFRDANCDSYLGSKTGSLALVEANGCTLRMTFERANELADFADGAP